MEIKDLVQKLCRVPSPSGFEGEAGKLAARMLGEYCSEVRTDVMGNVIGVRSCGKPGAPKLLLDAHIDEIGFIVTDVTEGFLGFSAIGGADARLLPGQEVTVLAQPPVYGIIAALPPHVLSAQDMERSIEIKDLYIDVGMTQEQAQKLIPIGTPGIFNGPFEDIGDGSICSRALDDKLGAAVLIKVMEDIKDAELDMDVYCMASVQEEVGLRGAGVGAFGVEPDYCIAVDVTFASAPDTPKVGTFNPGSGAAILAGPNGDRRLTKRIKDTAEKCGIPYTVEVASGRSGTNGWAIQVCRRGVATAVISIPIKYMHSSVEMAKLSDAEAVRRLIGEFIKGGVSA